LQAPRAQASASAVSFFTTRHVRSPLTSDYVEANGIRLPTKRRAFTRGPDRRPILEMLTVSIDISDVSFTNRTVIDSPGLSTIQTG